MNLMLLDVNLMLLDVNLMLFDEAARWSEGLIGAVIACRVTLVVIQGLVYTCLSTELTKRGVLKPVCVCQHS